MKVNLELCLVGGYTFQQYFMLYDELPTRFVIEPKKKDTELLNRKGAALPYTKKEGA